MKLLIILSVTLLTSQSRADHWDTYQVRTPAPTNYEYNAPSPTIRLSREYGGGVDVRVNNERVARCYQTYSGVVCK
jgi:hypothetical protein